MLRLLLLSDIHFLSLYDEMDCNASIRKVFLRDLKDFRDEHGVVNHILVCGDIAYKGVKEEYDKAHIFFKELCNIVGCNLEEIYIVPGNHDKNFCAPNDELRHLFNAGLSNESIDPDKMFVDLLNKNFAQFKILYQPFKDYQDFAVKMLSVEPLMAKCLDEDNMVSYDNEKDKAYMMTNLGEICGYPVNLYAMNTTLCSDWYDFKDSGKGHKLFLPKLGYMTSADKEGCINIAMMHHPIDNLVDSKNIASVLDETFQVQIFGHLHQPVSNVNEAVHIHSGALQPHRDENDRCHNYFSVYNILELDITNIDGKDSLKVNLRVEKYDEENKIFKKIEKESNIFYLTLKKHKNRWKQDDMVKLEVFPEGVTERMIKYRFLQLDNPKAIMIIMHYSYDENKSHNKNCIEFLNSMQAEGRMLELWNIINDK